MNGTDLIGSTEVTNEIIQAFDHVREFFPEVTMVVYGLDTRWLYLTENETPNFGAVAIDVSLLEDAANSLDSFPSVFQLKS